MKRLYNLLACVLVGAFAISCEYEAMMDGVYYPEMDGAAMQEENTPLLVFVLTRSTRLMQQKV